MMIVYVDSLSKCLKIRTCYIADRHTLRYRRYARVRDHTARSWCLDQVSKIGTVAGSHWSIYRGSEHHQYLFKRGSEADRGWM